MAQRHRKLHGDWFASGWILDCDLSRFSRQTMGLIWS
jgi:hypothetical protein